MSIETSCKKIGGTIIRNKCNFGEKPTLIVPIGISGSGKSTFLKGLAEIVNPDKIRKKLTGNIGNQERNAEVFSIAHRRTKELLMDGKDVIFDATNTYPASRQTLKRIGKDSGANIKFVYFDVPLEFAIKRVDKRESLGGSGVPHDVIERQHQQLSLTDISKESKDFVIIRKGDLI